MNQLQRDKRAIRTILSQVDEATPAEILLRGGEGLTGQALLEMVSDGEVLRREDPEGDLGFTVFYKLAVTA